MRCARVADRLWRGGKRGDACGPRGVWDGKDAGLQEEALEHPGGAQAEGKDFQCEAEEGEDGEGEATEAGFLCLCLCLFLLSGLGYDWTFLTGRCAQPSTR